MIRLPSTSDAETPVMASWSFWRVGLVAVLGLGFISLSVWARGRVDADLQVEEAHWRLFLDRLPAWFPPVFRGELAALVPVFNHQFERLEHGHGAFAAAVEFLTNVMLE